MKWQKNISDHDYQRLVEQETLIADATELVCELLEEHGVERRELARRLGKSKGHVTQLLSGERNMTLRTVADVAFALGHRFELDTAPLAAPRHYERTSDKVRPAAAFGRAYEMFSAGAPESWRQVSAYFSAIHHDHGSLLGEQSKLAHGASSVSSAVGPHDTPDEAHEHALAA